MSEESDQQPEDEKLSQERAQALALTLAASLRGVTQAMETQASSILGIAAVLAALPQTADVDPVRVSALIQLMTSKQADPGKTRTEMTRMASMIVDSARRIRQAEKLSQAKKAEAGKISSGLSSDRDDPLM